MNRSFVPACAAVACAAVVVAPSCVPAGSAPQYDAGASQQATASFRPSLNIMTAPFVETFDRPDGGTPDPVPDAAFGLAPGLPSGLTLGLPPGRDAGADAAGLGLQDVIDAALADAALADAATRRASNLGPNWLVARDGPWRIEKGALCAENARNRGVWLNRVLPVNARIEYEATAHTDDGDLKSEVWGDGRSAATSTSYTNATSYLVILGGWHNSIHALARLNEHGTDRREVRVDPNSDDPRQRAVVKGQTYQFKIERTDGKTVSVSVNGIDYFSWTDPAPLAGQGHDHLGFNEWEAKVCFDNVKVTPL